MSSFQVVGFVEEVGYPVLVRPSYVLSGAAMNVCYDRDALEACLSEAATVSNEHPVVVSEFLEGCREIEMDAVADKGKIIAQVPSMLLSITFQL